MPLLMVLHVFVALLLIRFDWEPCVKCFNAVISTDHARSDEAVHSFFSFGTATYGRRMTLLRFKTELDTPANFK